ncbi:MAG: transposase domain-containing protein [Planctomycetota bacterium]|nr:MAG: transposase domain-containing protein [Planctomycetota bacterium]
MAVLDRAHGAAEAVIYGSRPLPVGRDGEILAAFVIVVIAVAKGGGVGCGSKPRAGSLSGRGVASIKSRRRPSTRGAKNWLGGMRSGSDRAGKVRSGSARVGRMGSGSPRCDAMRRAGRRRSCRYAWPSGRRGMEIGAAGIGAAATCFSLIATCQRHRVEPMAYLRDVLTRIAAIPVSQFGTLLPDRWQPAAAD